MLDADAQPALLQPQPDFILIGRPGATPEEENIVRARWAAAVESAVPMILPYGWRVVGVKDALTELPVEFASARPSPPRAWLPFLSGMATASLIVWGAFLAAQAGLL